MSNNLSPFPQTILVPAIPPDHRSIDHPSEQAHCCADRSQSLFSQSLQAIQEDRAVSHVPRQPRQVLHLFVCGNAKRIHRICQCWPPHRGKLIPELEDERGQLSRNRLQLMLSSQIHGSHRDSSVVPQRVDKNFVLVLHPPSQAVQHHCAVCSAGMWYKFRLSTYLSSLAFLCGTQVRRCGLEHKVRMSSFQIEASYVRSEEPRG